MLRRESVFTLGSYPSFRGFDSRLRYPVALSSNGKDARFSPWQSEFDSP